MDGTRGPRFDLERFDYSIIEPGEGLVVLRGDWSPAAPETSGSVSLYALVDGGREPCRRLIDPGATRAGDDDDGWRAIFLVPVRYLRAPVPEFELDCSDGSVIPLRPPRPALGSAPAENQRLTERIMTLTEELDSQAAEHELERRRHEGVHLLLRERIDEMAEARVAAERRAEEAERVAEELRRQLDERRAAVEADIDRLREQHARAERDTSGAVAELTAAAGDRLDAIRAALDQTDAALAHAARTARELIDARRAREERLADELARAGVRERELRRAAEGMYGVIEEQRREAHERAEAEQAAAREQAEAEQAAAATLARLEAAIATVESELAAGQAALETAVPRAALVAQIEARVARGAEQLARTSANLDALRERPTLVDTTQPAPPITVESARRQRDLAHQMEQTALELRQAAHDARRELAGRGA